MPTRLHVHLAPLAPVGRGRLPLVRAGHAAARTAAASAVVLIGVGGHDAAGGSGDVREHQRWRRGRAVRRRSDAQRRQQWLAHGHRGQGDRADGQRHGPRGVHRGAVERAGRGKRWVQHALADVPALIVPRAGQVGVHFLDRRQHHLCTNMA